MWNWIRKKLGIVDYTDKLIDLDTKIYESIKLVNECLVQLDFLKQSSVDLGHVKTTEIELKRQLSELKRDIKAIPKEITIRNVLSI